MPATLTAAPTGTLGTSPGPLALRIRGTERDGQTVKLHSSKIVIGSGPQCTLRLRGAPIAPVHCLILRGQKQTVVRRWNLDTRLNGAGFEDAPLVVGDRLNVGPIEFEVLPSDVRPVVETLSQIEAVPSSSILPSVAQSVVDETARAVAEEALVQERAVLAERSLELRVKHDTLTTEREKLTAERETLSKQQNALNERSAEIDLKRAAIDADQTALTVTKLQQETSLHDLEASLKAQQEALQTRDAELQTQTRAVEQQKQDLNERAAQFDTRAAQVAEREARISERESEIENRLAAAVPVVSAPQADASAEKAVEEAKAALEVSRREFEAAQQAWQNETAQRTAELNARQSKIDETQSSLAQEQASLEQAQTALHGKQSEIEQSQAELERQRTEFEAARNGQAEQQARAIAEFDALKLSWQQERDARETQFAETSATTVELANRTAELNQRTADLDRRAAEMDAATKQLAVEQASLAESQAKLAEERAKFAAEQEQFAAAQDKLAGAQAQVAAALAQVATEKEQIAAERNQLATEKEQLAEECKNFIAEREELATERAEVTAERERFEQEIAVRKLPEATATEEATGDVIAKEAAAAEEAQSEPSGEADQDDVFARLRALSLIKDGADGKDETQATSAGSVAQEENRPERRKSDSTPENVAAPRRKDDPAPAGGEDETIDDYMARLLERMRGISGDASADSTQSAAASARRGATGTPIESADAVEVTTPEKPRPKRPFVMEARNAAPERSNLAAMREIANLSSRNAIAAHQHKRGKNKALGGLGVGIFGLVCAVGLLCMTPDMESPFFFGGLIALIMSGYWVVKSGFLARNVRNTKNFRKQQLAAIAAEQKLAQQEAEPVAVAEEPEGAAKE